MKVTGLLLDSTGAEIKRGPNVRRAVCIEEDFTIINASTYDRMLGTAISAGTAVPVAGTVYHPGIVALRDSTTANGGYRISTDVTALVLAGGEKASFIFSPKSTVATTTARLGFHDGTSVTAPVDGVYFEITGASSPVIKGVTSKASTKTNTATYSATLGSWYKGTIELNADATLATFVLYSDSGTELWRNTIGTTLPNASANALGFGVLACETTTSSAADIIWIDYMSMEISRDLVR